VVEGSGNAALSWINDDEFDPVSERSSFRAALLVDHRFLPAGSRFQPKGPGENGLATVDSRLAVATLAFALIWPPARYFEYDAFSLLGSISNTRAMSAELAERVVVENLNVLLRKMA
jgi:hypothetical protein